MNRRVTLLIVTILLSTAAIGFSQTNDEGLAFLQLNFINPGARSLAMGGAFIGMADDATAALANPAGLTILIKPEISVEFASTDYTNDIPWTAGRQFADLEIVGTQANFSNFSREFFPEEFSDRVNNISFASFVYPVAKSRFVIAGFYNEQTKFKREFQTDSFDGFPACIRGGGACELGDPANGFFFATDNELDLAIRNFGFSGGIQPGENFSFGFTLNYSTLDIESNTLRLDNRDAFPGLDERLNQEALTGDDSAFSYSLGVLINPGGVVSVGGVYTNRPEFDVTSTYTVFSQPNNFVNVTDQVFTAPDSYGFGFTVRPSDAFSINLDVNRILYSQLNDSYYNAFFNPALGSSDPINNDPIFAKESFEIEDTTEVRVGGEYIFTLGNTPFAVRLGYWRENFHSLVNRVDDANLVGVFDIVPLPGGGATIVRANDVDLAPWFSRDLSEDYNHVTFGTGFVFERFTIDWAYDYSENFKRFVISSVFYLGS
jgi:long-subunit fatty acid transport protein